jgi:hypothetical protein
MTDPRAGLGPRHHEDPGEPEQVEVTFTINGTRTNPFAYWGLSQNPFPSSGIHEFAAAEARLASLGGEPVLSEDDIRDRLRGFDPAFVERCIRAWVPGQIVHITMRFPRGRT